MYSILSDKKSLWNKIGIQILASSSIAIIIFIVFVRVLNADFLYWDDDWLIFENAKLGILNLHNIWSILKNDYVSSDTYTPLAGLRFCIIHTLSGLKPFNYHLANLLFHVTNAILFFGVVKKLVMVSLGESRSITIPNLRLNFVAAMAALIWSLNPLMVESTAWVNGGAHAQSVSFILLSLLSYIRANENKKKSVHWLIASIVFYSASILSQLTTLTFPVILFILDVYPLKRIRIGRGCLKSLEVRRAILEKIPFITVTFIVVAVDIILLNKHHIGHYVSSLTDFGLLDRTMQAFYVYAYYLWRPWYPVDLSLVYLTLYSFNPLSIPFIVCAFGVVGFTIVILLLRHRYPSIMAAWLCYLTLLIPLLGLILHPYITADRYAMCVSMIWSVLLAGWIITAKKSFQIFIISGVVLILISFAIMSSKQVTIWQNTGTLCRYMLDRTKDEPNNPERAVICDHLAIYYLHNGRLEETIPYLTEAIQINPEDVNAYHIRGIAYSMLSNYRQAIEDFNRAIEISPGAANTYYNRGITYGRLGNYNLAVEDLKTAVKLGHEDAKNLLRR